MDKRRLFFGAIQGSSNPVYQGHGGLLAVAVANANLVVTLPSGITDGDILIASIMLTDNNTTDTPPGWSILQTNTNGSSGNFSYTTYWRRATDAASGTVTFVPVGPWSGLGMGIIYRFTGCIATGTPFESETSVQTAPTTGSTKVIAPTPPTGAQRLGVVIGICEDNTATSIAGTGWTQNVLLSTSTGTDGAMALATKNLSNGDSVGDVTLTMSSSLDYASISSFMLLPI